MALRRCRACNAPVSSEAVTCPQCGVPNPARNPIFASPKKRRSLGCFALIFIVIAIAAIFDSLNSRKPSPDELGLKQEQDTEFLADFKALNAAGIMAVAAGGANKFEISGWDSSLDLYLGNRSTAQAASLSNHLCNLYFKEPFKSGPWKVRVYLLDNTVAAECNIH